MAVAPAKKTVGEIEDLLTACFQRLSAALFNPPTGQAQNISDAMNIIQTVLNEMIVKGLHRDAQVLGKLTTVLTDKTAELVKLKETLKQMAEIAAFGAALLNTMASIIPIL
jgi:hypothetical protein